MSVPGFGEHRDEEGAPFYLSREREFATPERTYAEILRRFTAVVRNGIHTALKTPQPIELEDLVAWHRSIFSSTFPHQAGVLRPGPSWFGVRWSEDGRPRRRMVEGVPPDRMRDELRAALGSYNAELRSRQPERRPYLEGLRTAAELYAAILRVHPFEDGNLRTAFPALQIALISLGVRPVDFEGDVADHDDALGWAIKDIGERTAKSLRGVPRRARSGRSRNPLVGRTMKGMTGRCPDLPGPAAPAVATSRGWVPLTDESIEKLARSGMLLALSPEHVQRLRDEALALDVVEGPRAV